MKMAPRGSTEEEASPVRHTALGPLEAVSDTAGPVATSLWVGCVL